VRKQSREIDREREKERARERERERERELYARWPLATTNHYLIMYGRLKGKNIYIAVDPGAPFQTAGSR